MEKVNELVLCKDEYETTEEFEDAIKTAIIMLLDNGYIATVRYDDKGLGIVVIEYDYSDVELCNCVARWLDIDWYADHMDLIN